MLVTISCCRNVHGFRIVLEADIRYFPTKIGSCFTKHPLYSTGTTAYHEACKKFGNEEVENIFNTCTTTTQQDNTNGVIPSLLFAATEDIVCLDAVYLVLKRELNVVCNI